MALTECHTACPAFMADPSLSAEPAASMSLVLVASRYPRRIGAHSRRGSWPLPIPSMSFPAWMASVPPAAATGAATETSRVPGARPPPRVVQREADGLRRQHLAAVRTLLGLGAGEL